MATPLTQKSAAAYTPAEDGAVAARRTGKGDDARG
jgi:hypothetical protein